MVTGLLYQHGMQPMFQERNSLRINSYLAAHGVASRRKSEEYVLTGRVKVNGQVLTDLSYVVQSCDVVLVDDELLDKPDKVYFLMNKPSGVITSTSDDKGRKTVLDLLKKEDRISNIHPVGRLDWDTQGALILTNDGMLTNILTHPSYKVKREYLVRVKGIVIKEKIRELRVKAKLEDGTIIKPEHVSIVELDKDYQSTLIRIVLVDGKNHEVKRIFKSIGHEVTHLNRVSYANLTTEGIKKGEYRPLKIHEIRKLFSLQYGGK